MSYKHITPEEQQSFANRMRAFRKKNGLTQKQMGQAIGLDKWTVLKLENCYERPFPSTVLAFARLEEKYQKAEEIEMESLGGTS